MTYESELVFALATAVLVRSRPWGAIVTKIKIPDMIRELLLCGYCLGFWVGAVAGLLTLSNPILAGFCVSSAAGLLTQLMALMDAATDYLNAKASESRK